MSRCRAERSVRNMPVSCSKASGALVMRSNSRLAGSRAPGSSDKARRSAINCCATGCEKRRSGRTRNAPSDLPSCSAPSRAKSRASTSSPAQGCAEKSCCAAPCAWRGAPPGKGISCVTGGADGLCFSRNSTRSATKPQSSSAFQGRRSPNPLPARAGEGSQATTGGASGVIVSAHCATSRPSRFSTKAPPSVKGSSRAWLCASMRAKAWAVPPRRNSGGLALPENTICSRLPAGTATAPPAAFRNCGGAPV